MVFTNLDFIRGKVILRLNAATPIETINVKLEGESRTRLRSQPLLDDCGAPMERQVTREELHKVRCLF